MHTYLIEITPHNGVISKLFYLIDGKQVSTL